VAGPAWGAIPDAAYSWPDAAALDAPREPDRDGLRRDTRFLLSYQVGTVGVLYMLPENVSNWSEEQKSEYGLAKWWENVRNPQWDTDDFYLNYILHPYWGAAYYIRARERGYDERGGFWYSVAMSSAFEFGVEALFEEPSLQDLVVTPVAGAILGEYLMGVRERTAGLYAPGEPMAFRHRFLFVLTDPIGAINRRVESWLGIEEGSAVLQPYLSHVGPRPGSRYEGDTHLDDTVYGVRFFYRW
jgi:hypothetical protein